MQAILILGRLITQDSSMKLQCELKMLGQVPIPSSLPKTELGALDRHWACKISVNVRYGAF